MVVLIESMENCLPQSGFGSKLQREKMWAKFHASRISPEFKKLWSDFLKLMSVDPLPLLYQYLADKMFQEPVTSRCTVNPSDLYISTTMSVMPCAMLQGMSAMKLRKESKIRSINTEGKFFSVSLTSRMMRMLVAVQTGFMLLTGVVCTESVSPTS